MHGLIKKLFAKEVQHVRLALHYRSEKEENLFDNRVRGEFIAIA